MGNLSVSCLGSRTAIGDEIVSFENLDSACLVVGVYVAERLAGYPASEPPSTYVTIAAVYGDEVPKGSQVRSTNVQLNTLQPAYNEHFRFDYPRDQKPNYVLITMYESKSGAGDDKIIGSTKLDVEWLSSEPKAASNFVTLNDDQGKAAAQLRLQIDARDSWKPSLLAAMSFTHVLEVTVIEASNLPNAARVGKSDPYCEISWGTDTKRTHAIKADLSPKWNSKGYFYVDAATQQMYKMQVAIKDGSKTIGVAYVDASRFLDGVAPLNAESGNTTTATNTTAAPVQDSKGSSGEIVTVQETLLEPDHQPKFDTEVKSGAGTGDAFSRPTMFASLANTAVPVGEGQSEVTLALRLRSRSDVENLLFTRIQSDFAKSDRSNGLTVHELGNLLRKLDMSLPDDQLHHLFTAADQGNDGFLGKEDMIFFLKAVENQSPDDAMRILDYLKRLDEAGSGISTALMTNVEQARSFVVDRLSGTQLTEKIPADVTVLNSIGRFIADTKTGHKLLARRTARKTEQYDKPDSVAKIAPFINMYNVNMKECQKPKIESYGSFNEFFNRRWNANVRPVAGGDNARVATCPADSRVLAFNEFSEARSVIQGHEFTVENVLRPAGEYIFQKFKGGAVLVSRIATHDVHWFTSPVAGQVGRIINVAGSLLPTSPDALRSTKSPLSSNSRVIIEIKSPKFGRVLVVPVGGIVDNCIEVIAPTGAQVQRGSDLGYFKLGGSVVLVFFQPSSVTFDTDLVRNSSGGIETMCYANTRMGVSQLQEDADFSAEPDQNDFDPTISTVDDMEPELLAMLTPVEKRALIGRYGATKFNLTPKTELTAEELKFDKHRFKLDMCLQYLRQELKKQVDDRPAAFPNFDLDGFMKQVRDMYVVVDADDNGYLDREELGAWVWTMSGEDAADMPAVLPEMYQEQVDSILKACVNHDDDGNPIMTFWDYVVFNFKEDEPFTDIGPPAKNSPNWENYYHNSIDLPERFQFTEAEVEDKLNAKLALVDMDALLAREAELAEEDDEPGM
jgi:phosphatidylserine decarboxylase precursor